MKDLRTLSHVPRWVVLRVIHRQSVADHSYYVAVYASLMATTEDLSDAARAGLLEYCLFHDMAESFTGDMPGPVKRSSCDRVKLSAYEDAGLVNRGLGFAVTDPTPFVKRLCVIANLLDEVCYLKGEIRLGNHEARAALVLSMVRLAKARTSSDFLPLDPNTEKLIDEIIACESLDQSLPIETTTPDKA